MTAVYDGKMSKMPRKTKLAKGTSNHPKKSFKEGKEKKVIKLYENMSHSL
jgi:hypothetical protein